MQGAKLELSSLYNFSGSAHVTTQINSAAQVTTLFLSYYILFFKITCPPVKEPLEYTIHASLILTINHQNPIPVVLQIEINSLYISMLLGFFLAMKKILSDSALTYMNLLILNPQ